MHTPPDPSDDDLRDDFDAEAASGEAGRFGRLMEIVGEAMDLPEDERSAFLDAACADDSQMRADAEPLIAAEAASGSYFERFGDRLANSAERAFEVERFQGRQIGAFEIQQHLGEGGMGQVYLAHRVGRLNQAVAIKIIKRGMDSDAIVRRFHLEQQILAGLDHPGIAKLIDAGVTDEGRSYLVMAYVKGVPIDRYCDDHRLTIDERLTLFMEVCDAVHHAHQNLVIHRDLKPGNILVREDGRPMLLDFGIAKLVNPSIAGGAMITQTVTRARLMTPEYASPEQVEGKSITTASDVYALGVLLYELLTGRRPYELRGQQPSEVQRIVCETTPRRPSTVVTRGHERPESDGSTRTVRAEDIASARSTEARTLRLRLRGDLDTVLLKALRKEANQRYATAAQFCEDLRRAQLGMPVLAQRSTLRYRLRLFARRRKKLVALGTALVVVLLFYLTTTLVQAQRIAEEGERAQREATRALAVNAFMRGLFAQVDPENARGDTLTAYDLLERGERTVRTDFATQPQERAAMLLVIGDLYHELGQIRRGKALLEEALRETEAAYGPEHIETARALNRLGLSTRLFSNASEGSMESIAYFERAIAIAEKQPGRTQVLASASYRYIADIYKAQARYDDATDAVMRAIAIGEAHDDAEAVWRAQSIFAEVQSGRGQLREAIVSMRSALREALRSTGPQSTVTADLRFTLGDLLYRTGQAREAQHVMQKVLDTRLAVYGPHHQQVANTYYQLGNITADLRDYSGAYAYYAQSLRIHRAWAGETNKFFVGPLNGLAQAAYQMDSLDTAMTYWNEALAVADEVYGPGHPSRSNTLAWMAHAKNAQGAYDEAEAYYDEVIALRRRIYGAGHHRVAQAEVLRARVYVGQERYAEAIVFVRRHLPLLEETLGAAHTFTRRTYDLLAELHEATGSPDSAAAVRAAQRAASLAPPSSP